MLRDPDLREGVAWAVVRVHCGRPSSTRSGCRCRVAWAPPRTTWYSPDTDLGVRVSTPASAVSADQQEAGLGVGEGPGIYLKTSCPPVPVPPGWAILCSPQQGAPWTELCCKLLAHASWDGPLRCRACRPCTLQHCLRVQGYCTMNRGQIWAAHCVPTQPGLDWACLQWSHPPPHPHPSQAEEGKIQGPAVRRRSCGERV